MATQQLMNPEQVSANARAAADGWKRDDDLARSKGVTPEHVAARQRMANFFCESHFAAESPELRSSRLAQIDYTMPVATVNGRAVDLQNPKAKGLMGMGRKPAYFVSASYPPKRAEDPIYALEYFPLKA